MGMSTGIVLTATGISLANEFIDNGDLNFRIAVAGLGVSLLFDGIERLDERAGVGLAVIMLITVLVTPINGKAPATNLTSLLNGTTKTVSKIPSTPKI